MLGSKTANEYLNLFERENSKCACRQCSSVGTKDSESLRHPPDISARFATQKNMTQDMWQN